MNKRLEYQGYVIVASPTQVGESEWSTRCDIEQHSDDGLVRIKYFDAADTWAAEDEAVRQCHAFGMRIIDGEVPGLSIGGIVGESR